MLSRLGNWAAALTLLLGVSLLVAIGAAADEIHFEIADVAATAEINHGAAELARGPAAVAPLTAPVNR